MERWVKMGKKKNVYEKVNIIFRSLWERVEKNFEFFSSNKNASWGLEGGGCSKVSYITDDLKNLVKFTENNDRVLILDLFLKLKLQICFWICRRTNDLKNLVKFTKKNLR